MVYVEGKVDYLNKWRPTNEKSRPKAIPTRVFLIEEKTEREKARERALRHVF